MRVLQLVPALTKGGAEKVLVDLANEAQRRGHGVAVVAGYPADPQLNRNRLDPQISFATIVPEGTGKLGAYLRLPLWVWRNRRWLDGFDVVHCHLTQAAVLGTLISWQSRLRGRAGPAVVETFHGVGMPIRARQRTLGAWFALRRQGFALMAQDPFWSGFLADHPALPSAIIANGMAFDPPADVSAANAWRAECGIPADAPVIGTVGRLRAERNPLATLAAFAEAAKLCPTAHFLIAGDGPMTDAVRATGAELGLAERLHLPGLVPDPRLALAAIDVYLSMNVGPITGIAGLEAAAAGLPVIALQARADYTHQPDDWIWASADPQEVGREAARLLGDAAAAAALAQRQQAHVAEHFGIAATQDAYETLYARAMAR